MAPSFKKKNSQEVQGVMYSSYFSHMFSQTAPWGKLGWGRVMDRWIETWVLTFYDITLIVAWTWEMQGILAIELLWLSSTFCFFLLLYSNVQGDSQTSICITIEPGLLLKGDILVRVKTCMLSFLSLWVFRS